MNIDDSRIRELAYQIWEAEGRPLGQEQRHWDMACKLAEAEAQNEAPPQTRSRQISKPRAVTLAEVEAEADQPQLLKKPRTRSSTAKKPQA